LGLFKTEKEAKVAYDIFAQNNFGEFAFAKRAGI